jgi:hypothetical protein
MTDNRISLVEKSINDISKNTDFLHNCLHIIQFCHLCTLGKIIPVLFTSVNSMEATTWKSSILPKASVKLKESKQNHAKHKKPEPDLDERR